MSVPHWGPLGRECREAWVSGPVQSGRVVLMPYGSTHGVGVGTRIVATGEAPRVGVGRALLGRVVDAFGSPLDARGDIVAPVQYPLYPAPRNPLDRAPIERRLST